MSAYAQPTRRGGVVMMKLKRRAEAQMKWELKNLVGALFRLRRLGQFRCKPSPGENLPGPKTPI